MQERKHKDKNLVPCAVDHTPERRQGTTSARKRSFQCYDRNGNGNGAMTTANTQQPPRKMQKQINKHKQVSHKDIDSSSCDTIGKLRGYRIYYQTPGICEAYVSSTVVIDNSDNGNVYVLTKKSGLLLIFGFVRQMIEWLTMPCMDITSIISKYFGINSNGKDGNDSDSRFVFNVRYDINDVINEYNNALNPSILGYDSVYHRAPVSLLIDLDNINLNTCNNDGNDIESAVTLSLTMRQNKCRHGSFVAAFGVIGFANNLIDKKNAERFLDKNDFFATFSKQAKLADESVHIGFKTCMQPCMVERGFDESGNGVYYLDIVGGSDKIGALMVNAVEDDDFEELDHIQYDSNFSSCAFYTTVDSANKTISYSKTRTRNSNDSNNSNEKEHIHTSKLKENMTYLFAVTIQGCCCNYDNGKGGKIYELSILQH